MQQFVGEIKHLLAQVAGWSLALCFFAYFSGAAYLIPGVLAGTLTSIVYFLLMSYRIQRSMKLPLAKAVTYMRIGWMIRLAFVLVMLIISIRISQLHFWAAVVGLLSLHFIILLNAIIAAGKTIYSKHYRSRMERGGK